MTGFWDVLVETAKYVAGDWRNLLSFAAAHLDLVVEALLIAGAIGVPLGIIAVRTPWAERSILGLANILQTVPSLALLGFLLIAFHGAIGKPPALTALVVYALLPIIKNTVLGLRGVDHGVIEAATGMGMTSRQRLRWVELPLAVPVILGGVRVAAVAAVGMATIASYIGAKGLGAYIVRGLATRDPRLTLMGAVPAAFLAIYCDAALGGLEHRLDPRRDRTSRLRGILGMVAILPLLGLALYGAAQPWLTRSRAETVVVGSKDGGEMMILGHMLADLIEDRTSLHVDRIMNLGGTQVCFDALAGGSLDLYVEYTGTALTSILKEPPRNDPQAVRDRVADVLLRQNQIVTMPPLGFENTFAMMMRRDQAESLKIQKISDLNRHRDMIRPGAGPEFMNRPDGYPGLVAAYGLLFRNEPREMDRNLLYEAVAQKTIDLAAGDSTDGRIAALDLVVLQDDKPYFPPYEAVPLVRAETLKKHPEIAAAIELLAGKIDANTMRRLNFEVDGKKQNPADVARSFLKESGLIGG